ncbi:MAG: beta-ketoacyl-[acyl-carrier-protein] synthase family protein [Desulfobacteraceae bacterium]|jgi:3-oxoacyl-[acyl-carrier-protein] synthase II
MKRRVVITAMGAVTSLGRSPKDIAEGIRKGRVSFQPSQTEPRVAVAPITGFDIRKHTGRHKNFRYLNRGASLAVAAAVDTVRNAGLLAEQLATSGLFVGSGPNLDLGGECARIDSGKMAPDELSALWILRFLPNTATSTISQLTGIRGENLTIGNACAASMQALGEGFRKIKHGDLDLAVAGGGDSRLSQGALLAYQKAQALYRGDGEPHAASRPFDKSRQGFVPGEGGAFFVLESADHAHGRGAAVLAEICGYGASMDGHAMTAPQPSGRWAEKAVRQAMGEAGMTPEQIDMISAHGTGTPLNDKVEAAMIERVFKGSTPMVLALKSWIGHLASACGAVELAICLNALQTGIWPQIRNLDVPCHPGLNYLRRQTEAAPRGILLQNFGFGGQNAALVVRTCRR